MSRDNKAYNNILELICNTPLVRLNKICDGFPGKYFTKYEKYQNHQLKFLTKYSRLVKLIFEKSNFLPINLHYI